MKIYDEFGVEKGSSSASGGSASSGTPLSSGVLSVLALDADGIALSQPLGVAADTNGIALSQAPTATVALTLEVAAASMIPARVVSLTSAADLSLINFTIDGVDTNGSVVQEIVAGPNANTVEGFTAFSSVTAITPDGTSASNVEAGWPLSTDPQSLILINPATVFSPTRRVSLTSASDLSLVTFTVTGTDLNGAFLTEDVVGPNISTVSTVARFRTVTLISPSIVDLNSVSAGWLSETAPLYSVPISSSASLSHVFAINTNAATQTLRLFLLLDSSFVPWRVIELAQDESVSVLQSESDLPLDGGDAIYATTTTDGAISYSIHGSEG